MKVISRIFVMLSLTLLVCSRPGMAQPVIISPPGTVSVPTGTVNNLRGFVQSFNGDVSSAMATDPYSQQNRPLSGKFQDTLNVRDAGAQCDGVTDDSIAFQTVLNEVSILGKSTEVNVPNTGLCLITKGLTATVRANQTLMFSSHGQQGVRLLYPAGFTGTGLAVTLANTPSLGQGNGEAFTAVGLTFVHAGSDTSGTALSVTTAGPGASDPSLDLSRLVFNSTTNGSWANGIVLSQMNVTSLDHIWCFSFHGTCIQYDSPGGISVEHHLSDIYVNGGAGATALVIGHVGGTAPIQGFTIDRLSCTGTDHCIQAFGAPTGGIDEITVRGSQFNSTIDNIYVNSANTVIATGDYFLGGSRQLDIEYNSRLVVTGSVFYLGPPSVGTTPNVSIYTKNLGGNSASGSVISGNLFTTLNNTPIYLDTGSNYVTISGNTCLGGQCAIDNSGIVAGNQNSIGPNLDSGQMAFATTPAFYAGLNVGPRNTPYPLRATSDGVGNASILAGTPAGAGIVTIGPNVTLQGTTAIQGYINVTGLLGLGTYTVPNLPQGCLAGQVAYATDGRKTGETAGAGTGVPVVCTKSGSGSVWTPIQITTASVAN